MFPTILIVDDEPSILQSLSGLLSDEGFEVITASNGYEALKTIDRESPDLVLLDIWMPGIDGIETLKQIKQEHPFIQVIIITGHGTIETAVKATKLGAFDLIEKPLSIDKVIVTINNALNFRRLEEENRYLRKKTIEKNAISGHSPPIIALKKAIAGAAPTDTWILITGENGTGKELVARTIHQMSLRAEMPLIDVNCAAIADGMIDSELFGREKGALPESPGRRRGKFELADKGTLFLDEIADMSLATQAKILRVLQEQRFQRVGGDRVLRVDVRVIAATNREMTTEIEQGRFREDLYHRLNVFPVRVPPLRERKEDIPSLVETFIREFARKNRCAPKGISPEALARLQTHSWPGNVRELKNLIERLMILSDGEAIEASDLPHPFHPAVHPEADPVDVRLFDQDRLKDARRLFEKEFIHRKLLENGNNIARTAEAIGVERSYLYRKLKAVGEEG